jgi:hypothetical protein
MHTVGALLLRVAVETKMDAVRDSPQGPQAAVLGLLSSLTQTIMPRDYWSRPPAAMNGALVDLQIIQDLVSSHRCPLPYHPYPYP